MPENAADSPRVRLPARSSQTTKPASEAQLVFHPHLSARLLSTCTSVLDRDTIEKALALVINMKHDGGSREQAYHYLLDACDSYSPPSPCSECLVAVVNEAYDPPVRNGPTSGPSPVLEQIERGMDVCRDRFKPTVTDRLARECPSLSAAAILSGLRAINSMRCAGLSLGEARPKATEACAGIPQRECETCTDAILTDVYGN
jgi:hypothetical protein